MRKLLHISMVAGLLAVGAGCQSNKVGLAAKSSSLNAYETRIGCVNTPAFVLGDVVALDPSTHKAQRVTTVQIDPTDVAFSQPADSASEQFNSPIDLRFSQSTPEFARNEASEAVSAQTVIYAKNWFTRGLKSPAAFATGSQQLAAALTKWHKENPDAKFFLVSEVTSADKVYLAFTGSDPIHVGKYTFFVDYQQNAQLDKLAQSTAAFFKATPLTVAEDKQGHESVAVDKNFSERIGDYDIPATPRPQPIESQVAATW